MVIHHMREVIGRNAVRLKDDNILIVLSNLHLALNKVLMSNLILNAALRAEAHNIRRTLGKFCLDVLHRAVTPDSIFAVIAEILLVGLLLGMRRSEFFLRAEARIGHAALYQTFDKGLINFRALTLAVRTICAVVAVKRCALVKGQAECTEHLDNGAHTALDLAFFIRILDTQIEHAV